MGFTCDNFFLFTNKNYLYILKLYFPEFPDRMVQCSVIIINYNTARLTLQAVRSVLKYCKKYKPQIIVVDNASQKKDYQYLQENIRKFTGKNVELIRNELNRGFGGGNMLGVENANGEYLVFLNSDAFLQEDSIGVMLDFLRKNPTTGIVGARGTDEHGKPYKSFDHRLSLKKELLGDKFLTFINPVKYPSRKRTYSSPVKAGAVPGSFFACRKEDFDKIGGFDPNLFLFYEEKDLAYRMEKHLKKDIYSLPQTTYIHLKGKSTAPSYEVRQELKVSQFYCVRKNLGNFKYAIFFSANLLKFGMKAPFSSKNRKYLKFILGGAGLSYSLKHRQQAQILRK